MKKLLAMLPMDGSKTYISGVLSIVTGVVGLVGHFFAQDTQFAMDVDVSIGMIITGLGLLGVGHKLDKMRDSA